MSRPGGEGGAREAEHAVTHLCPPVTELKKPQMAKNLVGALTGGEGSGGRKGEQPRARC